VKNQTMRNTSTSSAARDRLFSLGLWTWLATVEQDAGRAALGALREDLERRAIDGDLS
jgi:hypothetical protein